MGFGGHAQDMNNRIKENRAKKPSQRPKFKENNLKGIYTSKSIKLKFKNTSEKELSLIKKNIKEKARLYRVKVFIIFFISFTVIISLFVYFFW